MNVKEYIFYQIYDLLESRLDQLGEIKTDDAWQICKITQNYSTITRTFAEIMKTMVLQKKAVKIGNGKYNILKPNTPSKISK